MCFEIIRALGVVPRTGSTKELRLVAEVSLAGEDHWDSVFVTGVDDFLIPHASARLNDRRNSRLCSERNRIGERKESVGS